LIISTLRARIFNLLVNTAMQSSRKFSALVWCSGIWNCLETFLRDKHQRLLFVEGQGNRFCL
jgi:hypothetical protein